MQNQPGSKEAISGVGVQSLYPMCGLGLAQDNSADSSDCSASPMQIDSYINGSHLWRAYYRLGPKALVRF